MNYKDNLKYQNNLYISKIFLLIFFFLLYIIKLNYFYKRNQNKNVEENSSSINGNFSLYNYFKYPQISIIITNIDKWALDKNGILNLILNLRNQTLNNIEIILTLSRSNFKEYKTLNDLCSLDKRIKIKITDKKDSISNLFYLLKSLKGKFVLIIDKYFNFKNNDFEKFYNFTKGKINNIFEFKIKRESHFLIKTKILRDINDQNIEIKNISSLIEYIISLPEPQLNYISVSLSSNNNYTALAYICMTSILYSKNINSYISFYLLISKDFTQHNINFVKSLYDQYDYFNITFIVIDKRYDIAPNSRYLTKETYFRCSLGELIPYLNKIIYLDVDVIVFKDLSNLYNINFNDKMILGLPLPKNSNYTINCGILLLNLKKMREINMEKKILNILINTKEKYICADQDIINKYFKEYIGVFPPENQARPLNEKDSIKFNNDSGNLYNNDYFLFSWKYPVIRHYNGYKPTYLRFNNNKFLEDLWYFARLSKYFLKKADNLNSIFNYTQYS